jgi:DNA transposition AAA+ family ATPase
MVCPSRPHTSALNIISNCNASVSRSDIHLKSGNDTLHVIILDDLEGLGLRTLDNLERFGALALDDLL